MSENVSGEEYRKVSLEEMGLVKGDTLPYALFVFLHASNRHHPIVEKGQKLVGQDWINLSKLDTSNLFISSKDFAEWDLIRQKTPDKLLKAIPSVPFNGQVLGDEARDKLKSFYRVLAANPLTGTHKTIATSALAKMSDGLLNALVPEAKDLKSALLTQMRNIHVMNDSAAISSLALLVALSNDFESRPALANISKACLLMDASLGDLDPDDLETYYRNRNELSTHVLDKIKGHSLKSTYMGEGVHLSEAISQMILVHHELYNGKGYHRGIRTSTVSPLARCLCLAVDMYEHMKGAELNNSPMSLARVIRMFLHERADPTQRRHARIIVEKMANYLGIK